MRARKTVEVDKVKEWANEMLGASTDDLREGRVAVGLLLERVLMETGNYKGFRYLRTEYLPAAEQTDTNVLREDYDDTRRRYF